jgi:hypothetical protein
MYLVSSGAQAKLICLECNSPLLLVATEQVAKVRTTEHLKIEAVSL